ncbi:MAG: xanthine dehydrogenase family protein subunit M [Deltaproteobacteria bacterium]|nr:xanthine dehydrogenase family protein subunit M [Deltaproteobacteria bacterium]
MRFEYLEATSVAEAIGMLQRYPGRAKILAGGTDLLVQMKQGSLRPEVVIHIGRIKALNGISTVPDGGAQIGTLTTMRTIEKSGELKGGLDILRQGAGQVSCPQIRNVATLGGNTCNGIPSADTVPALIALGAEAIILGPGGERMVPMEEFHRGPGRTVLNPEEILQEFKIPAPPPCTGGCYLKYTPRGTFELAIVGVAALVTLNPKDGTCRGARIVLGACGPTPLRIKKAEAALLGKRLDPVLIETSAQIAAEEARPNPGVSVRASAPYRREMVKVWTKYALEKAHARAEALGNP